MSTPPAGRSDAYVAPKGYQCDHRAHPYVVICPVSGCGACGQSLATRGWGGVSDDRGRICVPCAASEFLASERAAQSGHTMGDATHPPEKGNES